MKGMEEKNTGLRVAVLGLGYVGCVSAACLADMGHTVIGIDRDANKISNVVSGVAPFYEPGLEALVKKNVAERRLTAAQDINAISEADVALVCVGTPSQKNGNLGLEQLGRVLEEIASTLGKRSKPLVLAIRSTVFPGTCEEFVMPVFRQHPLVTVVCNPEFLREGTAIRDFVEPSLIVVGGQDPKGVDLAASLYARLKVATCKVTLRTAEMIKYACNAFHAVKIAFANEIGSLSARMEVDPAEVLETLCQDTKLNVSAAYLKPGFAFGGSCLPKDLRALTFRANRVDLKLPLLEAAIPSNQQHLQRSIDAVMEVQEDRVGLIGLSFKENTDDLRESPLVTLLEHLIGKGRSVRVFDPHIRLDVIYGSNRNYILQQIPHIGRLLDSSIDDTIAWANHLVLGQKLSPENAAKVAASGLPVTDLVGSSLSYLSAVTPVAQ